MAEPDMPSGDPSTEAKHSPKHLALAHQNAHTDQRGFFVCVCCGLMQ